MGGEVAQREEKNTFRILVRKPELKSSMRDQSVGCWIILKCICYMWDDMSWTGFIWNRIRTSGSILRVH
jgi:hypothetical protein